MVLGQYKSCGPYMKTYISTGLERAIYCLITNKGKNTSVGNFYVDQSDSLVDVQDL